MLMLTSLAISPGEQVLRFGQLPRAAQEAALEMAPELLVKNVWEIDRDIADGCVDAVSSDVEAQILAMRVSSTGLRKLLSGKYRHSAMEHLVGNLIVNGGWEEPELVDQVLELTVGRGISQALRLWKIGARLSENGFQRSVRALKKRRPNAVGQSWSTVLAAMAPDGADPELLAELVAIRWAYGTDAGRAVQSALLRHEGLVELYGREPERVTTAGIAAHHLLVGLSQCATPAAEATLWAILAALGEASSEEAYLGGGAYVISQNPFLDGALREAWAEWFGVRAVPATPASQRLREALRADSRRVEAEGGGPVRIDAETRAVAWKFIEAAEGERGLAQEREALFSLIGEPGSSEKDQPPYGVWPWNEGLISSLAGIRERSARVFPDVTALPALQSVDEWMIFFSLTLEGVALREAGEIALVTA